MVQWCRERSVEVEGDGNDADGSASMAVAVRLPGAPAPPLDRLGFRDVGESAGRRDEPRIVCLAPSPLFILRCSAGAHQPLRVGRPRSERGLRAWVY